MENIYKPMTDIKKQIQSTVHISLFTALIITGTYIKIPIGPIPAVLTNFFIFTAGLLLGWKQGTAAVALYLLLGAVGFPVFSSGGGLFLFAGPTGGYLIGYLPAVFLIGIISGSGEFSVIRNIAAVAAGLAAVYVNGVPWLKIHYDISWLKALSAGFLPFIVWDIVKGAAAVAAVSMIKKNTPDLFPRFLKREGSTAND